MGSAEIPRGEGKLTRFHKSHGLAKPTVVDYGSTKSPEAPPADPLAPSPTEREEFNNLPGGGRRGGRWRRLIAPIVIAAAGVGVGKALLGRGSSESKKDPEPGTTLNTNKPVEQIPTEVTVSTVPPTTEAPTTTIPVVFQSEEGKVLRNYGYSSDNAEQLVGNVRNHQVIETTHPTHILNLVDLPYSPEGAETVQKGIEELVRNERVYTINPYGTGEVTVKFVPKTEKDQRDVVYLSTDMPHPLRWSEFNKTSSSYGSTKGNSTVGKVDVNNPSSVYHANIIAVGETIWREARVEILSQAPGVNVSPTIAEEVLVNWIGKVWGHKISGNTFEGIRRDVKRTVNVHTSSTPLQLPNDAALDKLIFDEAPGAQSKVFG
jgi:hypothetical protein